jgi:Sjoegren syndrome nuclear autoantigen 1
MLPSTLQQNNNELFEVLETLKSNKLNLEKSISQLKKEEEEIQDKISKLNSDLSLVKSNLIKCSEKKSTLETLISDTEVAYEKIIDSSSSLLSVLKSYDLS